MSEMRACVECGREGFREFEPAGALAWRCTNREACQRRQHDAQLFNPADRASGTEGDRDPGRGFASVAAVAGVAREVEALRQRVRGLRGLAGQVEDLARVVTELAERVSTRSCRAEPVVAVSWLDAPGAPQELRAVLADLVDWLARVYLRYPDAARGLAECWLWHPEVIEELLWLRQAWHAAYRAEDATVAKAADWHDRYRPGVVRRVHAAIGKCSVDNHLPRAGRPTGAAPVVPLATATGSMTAWWATDRDNPPPPPSDDQLAQAAAGGRSTQR